MSTINPTYQYVKFIKGTSAAFTNLLTKDDNTLYFISDDNLTGKLYLGSKLIGGADGTTTQLSALLDVALASIGDGQILIYNGETKKWENASPNALVSIMSGASASADGTAGLVPVPRAGDQFKFLSGDGTWKDVLPSFTSTDAKKILSINDAGNAVQWRAVSTLADEIKTSLAEDLYTKDEVDDLIAAAAFMKRKVAESTDAIDLTAEDADRYIYMVRNDNEDGDNLYNEYIVVDGALELISDGSGTGSVDLSNYATKSELTAVSNGLSDLETSIADNYVLKSVYTAEVGNLNELIKADGVDTLVDQVNELTDRLTWYQLEDE